MCASTRIWKYAIFAGKNLLFSYSFRPISFFVLFFFFVVFRFSVCVRSLVRSTERKSICDKYLRYTFVIEPTDYRNMCVFFLDFNVIFLWMRFRLHSILNLKSPVSALHFLAYLVRHYITPHNRCTFCTPMPKSIRLLTNAPCFRNSCRHTLTHSHTLTVNSICCFRNIHNWNCVDRCNFTRPHFQFFSCIANSD